MAKLVGGFLSSSKWFPKMGPIHFSQSLPSTDSFSWLSALTTGISEVKRRQKMRVVREIAQ